MRICAALFVFLSVGLLPASAQTRAAPEQKAVAPAFTLPPALRQQQDVKMPALDDDEEDDDEVSLPLGQGKTIKGKLGSGWTFQSLPSSSEKLSDLADPRGKRFDLPSLRGERHTTLGGRKSNANGLSIGLDFDLPR